MTPDYFTAVLALVATHPGALVLNTLWILFLLHVALPVAYLLYRMMGGGWDGIEFARAVLAAVHELRRATLPHFSDVSPTALHPSTARTRNT